MEINAQNLFFVIIGIIVLNFVKDSFLDYLNSKYFDKKPPKNVENLFEKEKYLKKKNIWNLKSTKKLNTILVEFPVCSGFQLFCFFSYLMDS